MKRATREKMWSGSDSSLRSSKKRPGREQRSDETIYQEPGGLLDRLGDLRRDLLEEARIRTGETRELRESIHAVGRQLETTVSDLTDNQDVIRGVQTFARLIQQSCAPETA